MPNIRGTEVGDHITIFDVKNTYTFAEKDIPFGIRDAASLELHLNNVWLAQISKNCNLSIHVFEFSPLHLSIDASDPDIPIPVAWWIEPIVADDIKLVESIL